MKSTLTTEKMPNARGRFGVYGGRYVPETLMAPLEELERAYEEARGDAAFQAQLDDLLKNFAGRPTPLQSPPCTLRRSSAAGVRTKSIGS